MSKGGDSSSIEIYLRIRPSPRQSNYISYDLAENKVEFNIPREQAHGYVNNQREHYEYKFNAILGPDAQQDEVYERVARQSVNSIMQGVNSTIFAYGQTGSGKTFTMTGGAEKYVDRGIIPRAVSQVYSDIQKDASHQYSVHVSYMEIYNEACYDLLDHESDISDLEDLPKVTLMEDDSNNFQFRNLSTHLANTEEECLNLLFVGDTNRTISETPMNMASSRSHCVFCLQVEARQAGAATVRRSKLNLVDLAGSERVSKTGVDGVTLSEAKAINVSLLYLQQVIVALQEQGEGTRSHVPYRNSIMTSVLKDSLGGNCRTAMVATCACEEVQLDESISTCRFAQRVAMVSNTVMVNEELDPTVVIKRLKGEIKELKEELRLLKGEDGDRGPLTEGEKERIKRQLITYLEDTSGQAVLAWESMMHIREAFMSFRGLWQGHGKTIQEAAEGSGPGPPSKAAAQPEPEAPAGGGGGGKTAPGGGGSAGGGDDSEQVKKLRLQIQQRDNEINILVSMLKKAQGGGPNAAVLEQAQVPEPSGAGAAGRPGPGPGTAATARPPPAAAGTPSSSAADPFTNQDLLADRNKAFEMFRKSYRKNEAIEENKALLKSKYAEAKTLGEAVNAARSKVNSLKALIEQRRIERSMKAVAEGLDPAELPPDPEEERNKAVIEREKDTYKGHFAQLRALKKEIEHLQLMLDQSRTKLRTDFEKWLESMLRQRAMGDPAALAIPLGGGGLGPPGAGSSRGSVDALSSVRSSGGSVASSTHTLNQPHAPPARQAGPKMAWGDSPGATLTRGSNGGGGPRGSVDPRASGGGPVLTGNAQADADIKAFYEAREKLLRARAGK